VVLNIRSVDVKISGRHSISVTQAQNLAGTLTPYPSEWRFTPLYHISVNNSNSNVMMIYILPTVTYKMVLVLLSAHNP